MPRSNLGKLCCWLGIGSVGAFGIFFALVASGQRGGDTFFSNLWLSIPVLAAAALAISGAVVGSVAVLGRRERAIAVFAVIAFGLFVAAFAAGELVFPH